MEWHNIAGLISTIALISPVIIIIAFRLIRYPQYIALFLYCLSAFTYNLMTEQYLVVSEDFQRTFGVVNNLMDAPLMLSFLTAFSTSKKQLRMMKVVIGLFLVFELVIIFLKGVTVPAIIIVIGPGLILVFSFTLYFFIENIKKSLMYPKFAGKALMASGVCFAYGCFAFLYVMYYIFNVPNSPYVFFIYFIISIIYCSLISIGLVYESKRKRKLEELLHTRKELIKFFEEEEKSVGSEKPRNLWGLN